MAVDLRSRRVLTALAAAVLFGGLGGVAALPSTAEASPAVSHTTSVPVSFRPACGGRHFDSRSCIQRAVAAIDAARSMESMQHPDLVLPNNYRSLDPAEQTFVVIDLERIDRGLRPLAGLVPALNADALSAAGRQIDPTPQMAHLQHLGVARYRTLWASSLGPLVSDYEWMYDDGYSAAGSSNVDCQSPQAAGCWAHRRAILATFDGRSRLLAGAASVTAPHGFDSITAILTGGEGSSPHFAYTWLAALRHGAGDSPGT
jgi:hypothetical protein